MPGASEVALIMYRPLALSSGIGKSAAGSRAAGLCRKLERAAICNALAVYLDEAGIFAADVGAAIAISTAGILDRDLRLSIFDDEAVAAIPGMAELDEFATAAHTDAARRAAITITKFPASAIN